MIMIATVTSHMSHLFSQLCFFTTQISSPFFCSNELTFITQSVLIGLFAIFSVKLGRGGLTGFMVLCWILGNLFVTKEATIFTLDVVTSDGFAIGSNLAIILLREYYGEKAAKNGIWIGFYTAFFFMIMSAIHLTYVPNNVDTMHPHFVAILSRMTRIISASFAVALVSKYFNLYLFNLLTRTLGDHLFGINTFVAMVLSELVDTTLFGVLALYGDVHSIVPIIVFSTAVKTISIAVSVPSIALARKFVSKHKTL